MIPVKYQITFNIHFNLHHIILTFLSEKKKKKSFAMHEMLF